MEFILVPVIFAIALLLLSLGKLLGKDQEFHTCSSEGEDCETCATNDLDIGFHSIDEAGLSNVAQLGNPNRKNRFIDTLDFRPDKIK